jgi:hypothetical protein
MEGTPPGLTLARTVTPERFERRKRLLVTVCAGRRHCQAWDTHRQHFFLMKTSLPPMTDRAFSALLDDLDPATEIRDHLDRRMPIALGKPIESIFG